MRQLFILFTIIMSFPSWAQDEPLTLNYSMFEESETIYLATEEGWLFRPGKDSTYSGSNKMKWESLKPTELTIEMTNQDGVLEGWFRLKIVLDDSFTDSLAGLNFTHLGWSPVDLFVNGKLVKSYGKTGLNDGVFEPYNYFDKKMDYFRFETNKEYSLLLYVSDKTDRLSGAKRLKSNAFPLDSFINLGTAKADNNNRLSPFFGFVNTLIALLVFLFWVLYFQSNKEKQILYPAVLITFLFIPIFINFFLFYSYELKYSAYVLLSSIGSLSATSFLIYIPLTLAVIFRNKIPKFLWYISGIFFLLNVLTFFLPENIVLPLIFVTGVIYPTIVLGYYIFSSRKTLGGPQKAFVIGVSIMIGLAIILTILLLFPNTSYFLDLGTWIVISLLLSFPLSLLAYIFLWVKESRLEKERNDQEIIRITQEKKELLENQNTILEQQVNERTESLNQSLENLKSTQAQLIQSEKMASLGELTAGIAHEIQNPLNFVNNFSEVSTELVDEMKEELAAGTEASVQLAVEIADDLKQNLEKITLHGKRADAIVKGMLEHSRANKGEKSLTDLNALADEFLRLSYHGLRAKDKSFNADFTTDFDPSLPKINVIPQDIGRVLLNVINNAFQACTNSEFRIENPELKPLVKVSTKSIGGKIEIKVSDNGPGIPDSIKEKIFQPFFTTKPTGSGTGLGLSLSYDIIKAHGGELRVVSEEGKGMEMKIILLIIKDS